MSTIKLLFAAALLVFSLGAMAADPVNVNSADAATLADAIDGIGPVKAAAIVAYRETHGPFKTVDDLLLVKGIGEATLEKNRDILTAATP
jgi:competence protein ComEA